MPKTCHPIKKKIKKNKKKLNKKKNNKKITNNLIYKTFLFINLFKFLSFARHPPYPLSFDSHLLNYLFF